jgi:hypothetical protein
MIIFSICFSLPLLVVIGEGDDFRGGSLNYRAFAA